MQGEKEKATRSSHYMPWRVRFVYDLNNMNSFRKNLYAILQSNLHFSEAAGFDKSVVGEGGAGILWDMRLSDKELERTSLLRPVLEDLQEDFTSDAESTSTEGPLLDSMDTNEQTEGAPEVKSRF